MLANEPFIPIYYNVRDTGVCAHTHTHTGTHTQAYVNDAHTSESRAEFQKAGVSGVEIG